MSLVNFGPRPLAPEATPCCVCPPTCETDDSGETCIDASCGVCLHGCPAGIERPCCRDLDDTNLDRQSDNPRSSMTTDPPCDENGVVLDETAPADDGPHRKPFAQFIQSHEYGQTHDELTRGLHDLLSAVQSVGKGGSLQMKVTAKPVGRGDERQVTVSVATKVTLPEMGSLEAIYWIDDEGNLTRNDPRQQQLPLQVVERPNAAAAKAVNR